MRLILCLMLAATGALAAQNPPLKNGNLILCTTEAHCGLGVHQPIEKIAPRPADVSSIDGMISAWYDVVSGPARSKRNWSRDHTLYIPGVRFAEIHTGKDGKTRVFIQDHQKYADVAQESFDKSGEGFYEHEIHRVTNRFGNIAQIFSTYESRLTPGGAVIARGVNSIEMLWDGERWWISYAQWDEEHAGLKLPKELLP